MSPRSRRAAAALVVLLAALSLLVVAPRPAAAHPLGDLTASRYSGLTVRTGSVGIDHVEDLAEIPTAQVRPEIDTDRDGGLAPAELARYAGRACARAAAGMRVRAGGRAVRVEPGMAAARTRPGSAGLLVLRVECRLLARYAPLRTVMTLTFRDTLVADQPGWREVTAVGDGVTLLSADVPRRGVSTRLTRYPADVLRSPPDRRSASLRVRPGGPAAAVAGTDSGPPVAKGVDRLTAAFTSLVDGRGLTPWFVAVAVLAAAGLGAAHALAPGHGKTVMAFYLVSRRDQSHPVRSALAVGASVTAAHTAGVLAFGLLVSAGSAIAPVTVFPWLTIASGGLIALVGVGLLRSARRRAATGGHSHGLFTHTHGPHTHEHGRTAAHGHEHRHGPGHDHGPGDGDGDGHGHGDGHGAGTDARAPGRLGLIAMGLAGGLLPSPTALVVFLGAVAVHRAWFGVLLVLWFGVGMACTLAGAGLLVRYTGRWLVGVLTAGAGRLRFARLADGASRLLPALTALGLCGVGGAIVARAALGLAGLG